MTKHMASLEIERQLPSAEALSELDKTIAEKAPIAPQLPEAPAAAPVKKHGLRRLLLAGAGLAGFAALSAYGWNYWTVGRFEVSTDDAYVKADNTTVAPKVSGYISEVLVGDNQRVKAGQVLARIDDRDFRAALDQATAGVAAANATIANKEAALDTQQSVIESARATVDVDQAQLTFAQQEDTRYTKLAATGYGTVQNAQRTASGTASARATVARDTAALATATKQLALLKAELAGAKANLAHAEAVLEQAKLNLSYTTIVAPVEGVVGNRSLRVGQYVTAGTQLMAVVPLAAAYIVANYKETQLTDVRAGQRVEIAVDMFPGVAVHGHVDSLAPASGQEFALLPPDNATGNFTKIVQRIPVKIILDSDSPLAGELRPGMSVTPTIETKKTQTREAAAQKPQG
ncbi:MAG TPA: HlyD family secretion protein [Methylovirgula sp.]|jgi:membrane fusion protein (multidrug efflux system)|nr:HlyD family secretion protein [Methylovirgula sp.]